MTPAVVSFLKSLFKFNGKHKHLQLAQAQYAVPVLLGRCFHSKKTHTEPKIDQNFVKTLLDTDIRFVLGVSIGKDTAGYAVTDYLSNSPQKLGVIDLHTLPVGAERASEIVGILSVLKQTHSNVQNAEKHTFNHPDNSNAASSDASSKKRWIMGLEDYLRVPYGGREVNQVASMTKMIGIVENDCSKLFGSSPFLVNPKVARQSLSKRAGGPLATREQLLEYAKSQVFDFPLVKDIQDKVSPKTLYMSDAWAVALYTKQLYEIKLVKSNREFLKRVKLLVERDKRVSELRSTIETVADPEVGKELQDVLRSRISQLTENHIREALNKS